MSERDSRAEDSVLRSGQVRPELSRVSVPTGHFSSILCISADALATFIERRIDMRDGEVKLVGQAG